MAPILRFLTSSGSKNKEPRYVCLSEAKASHSHKKWTEVSPSVPHFLQLGLLLSPIIYKCLLKVLCPVRRPMTTLDCVLLIGNNRSFVARSGSEINSPACLCVQHGPCHNTKYWFSIQRFISLRMFCLETPPRKALVHQTFEQNCLLRACRRFHFLVCQHRRYPMGPRAGLDTLEMRQNSCHYWESNQDFSAVQAMA